MRMFANSLPVLLVVAGCLVDARVEVDDKSMEELERLMFRSACWGDQAIADDVKAQRAAMKRCGLLDQQATTAPASVTTNPGFRVQQIVRSPVSTSLLPSSSFLYNPYVQVHRGKRDVTAADKQEVIDSVNDYAAQTLAKVTALRCVKIELGELDKNGQLDPSGWTKENLARDLASTKAGKDQDFVNKFLNEILRCYNIYQNTPFEFDSTVHPLVAEAERQKVFFDCGWRAENQICAKYLLNQFFQEMYGVGPLPAGLPADKFDAATRAIKALDETVTPEAKYVNDYYFSKKP